MPALTVFKCDSVVQCFLQAVSSCSHWFRICNKAFCIKWFLLCTFPHAQYLSCDSISASVFSHQCHDTNTVKPCCSPVPKYPSANFLTSVHFQRIYYVMHPMLRAGLHCSINDGVRSIFIHAVSSCFHWSPNCAVYGNVGSVFCRHSRLRATQGCSLMTPVSDVRC